MTKAELAMKAALEYIASLLENEYRDDPNLQQVAQTARATLADAFPPATETGEQK